MQIRLENNCRLQFCVTDKLLQTNINGHYLIILNGFNTLNVEIKGDDIIFSLGELSL